MNMEKHYGPLNEEFLLCIEQFWQFGLPKDYKIFLLKFNGGVPKKTAFNFKGKQEGSVLDSFYGIVRGNDNILLVAKDIGHRYPSTMLPIADDVFGNRILLSVKGPDRGKVYFWDHEMEAGEGEEPSYDNLTLIADSFDEFINSLHDMKE
ncbi:MAG: hypothetical protein A2X70_04485 [Alphaproteobacteria bacterium GWC2_42_16]|nr:MAG: hypothetical protein A2X70_04485 [Alphaproteobacteria bacterium GWC2_42_16]OFW73341.1 MAG: hypothetical protein A2Z80_07575 [Alphaproteobacteria bacterium GWA2_41_27]OFW81807.1 MAG: hypothetical protein A3E50_02840 [Alphaproteobacteria bacterium RIFCSPHIGHO2_12_FULL_42_100]OFW85674.1 MAG: hypothetical protein A2W06_06390 [Alphaproteobacteria bacterium RBG_16_42_14]OFW90833.1 MAG: hypothetical protein A3C41_01910 [Alphaproteobacteria bacterium RIFCSPHIGHO2_02_FULL_42_30]OFW92453.1 MAG: 